MGKREGDCIVSQEMVRVVVSVRLRCGNLGKERGISDVQRVNHDRRGSWQRMADQSISALACARQRFLAPIRVCSPAAVLVSQGQASGWIDAQARQIHQSRFHPSLSTSLLLLPESG